MLTNFLNPEIVVYIYMASCAAVLVFNLLYIASDKSRGKSLEKRSAAIKKEIQTQLERLKAREEILPVHVLKMAKKLQRLDNLKAYELAYMQLREEEKNEIMKKYQGGLYEIFLKLVVFYEKRDEIERAYFARLIESLKIKEGSEKEDALTDFLLNSVSERNVYIRENAYKALYSIGNIKLILLAWKRQEEEGIFHNKKLLTDGLLTFAGDKRELAETLWRECENFPEELVLPVMQFIRFSSGDFTERFLEVMKSGEKTAEIHLEAIRYFRRYVYEPAREVLKEFIKTMNTDEWAYAAMAAQSLASYPGPDVVDMLKEGLRSINWYVRLNCAEALIVGLKIPKSQLLDVYNGRDRYAREILDYVTERIEKR